MLNADLRRRRTPIRHTRLLSNDAHVLLRMAGRWKGDLVILHSIDDIFAIQCSGGTQWTDSSMSAGTMAWCRGGRLNERGSIKLPSEPIGDGNN